MEGQMTLFDYTRPMVHIDTPIRLIETFAGYGSQALALKNLGADFETHRVYEIDKYAMASYNAIHGTNFEPITGRRFSQRECLTRYGKMQRKTEGRYESHNTD